MLRYIAIHADSVSSIALESIEADRVTEEANVGKLNAGGMMFSILCKQRDVYVEVWQLRTLAAFLIK